MPSGVALRASTRMPEIKSVPCRLTTPQALAPGPSAGTEDWPCSTCPMFPAKSRLLGVGALAFQDLKMFVADVHGAAVQQAVVPELDHKDPPAPS